MKRHSFLVFVVAMLFVDFVLGFVYGFIGESRKRAITTPPPPPHVADTGSDTADSTGAGREGPGETLGSTADVNPLPLEDPRPTAAQDDPESFESIVQQLLAAAKMQDDGASERDVEQDAQPDGDGGGGTADAEPQAAERTEVGQAHTTAVDDDPEDDLYTFNVPGGKPSELSAEVRRGDEYLEKARKLLAKWDRTRSKSDMARAKAALRKAKSCYANAKRSPANEEYIEQQVKLTNQLLYLAIKSSQF